MTEVDIPGGTAVLRDPGKLSVRQKRPLEILQQELGARRFQQILTVENINPPVPDGVELTAVERVERQDRLIDAQDALQLTRVELGILLEMTDATIFALLESWTLPIPVPATLEQIGDMDSDVHDVLALRTAALQADFMARNGFGLEAIKEPESPTGASAGYGQPSPEAETNPSPDGQLAPGGSTATAPSSAV